MDSIKKPHQGLSPYEQLMYSTLRIVTDKAVGTGFVVCLDLKNIDDKSPLPFPVIITNRHVVDSAQWISFVVANQDKGAFAGSYNYTIRNPQDWVFSHPDLDLAAIPLWANEGEIFESKTSPFYVQVREHEIATIGELTELAPGMPVKMIGYPNGLWDQTNNLPLFRSGIAATHPGIPFDGKEEFMVDMACFPGSSGSPVWYLSLGSYTNKHGKVEPGTRGRLLGVLYSGPIYHADGTVTIPDPLATHTATVGTMMNLGLVIRGTRILDFKSIFQAKLPELLQRMKLEWVERGRELPEATNFQ